MLKQCLYPYLRTREVLWSVVHTGKLGRVHSSSPSIGTPITSVLIANRGEIALRVGRTARANGIQCTTVYTDPDARAQHALASPYTVNLGPSSAYLDGERIIQVAKAQGCQALHPGYGFLSENSGFAKRCQEEGLIFIGPPWRAIEAMGNKSRSKDIMNRAGVLCVPGYHGANQEPEFLLREAKKIGFPVLVKAVRGGGGKGMRIVHNEFDFLGQLQSAMSEGRNAFGDDEMLIEKYITKPRHIEVQIFADKHGNVVALGERDCSIQRRHQKILEEAPAPNLAEHLRQDLWEKARAAAMAVAYEGAGTVEFIFDNETNQFYFMEMNTRLQVEHPVTEAVTGEDLVLWQFKVASGEPLPLDQSTIAARIADKGSAIEARIYAEDPCNDFMPDSGHLIHLKSPATSQHVRIDAGFVEGDTVSSAYDGMLSKLIVSGSTREIAIRGLHSALQEYEIVGVNTNIEFLKKICQSPAFMRGELETGYIAKYGHELFLQHVIEPEVYVQAALSSFLSSIHGSATNDNPHGIDLGLMPQARRTFRFHASVKLAGSSASPVTVHVSATSPELFDVEVLDPSGKKLFSKIRTFAISSTAVAVRLLTFFDHTRIETMTVYARDDQVLSLFQRGLEYKLRLATPSWHKKALGTKVLNNGVSAPMPCKVLRNEVEVGDLVQKDQALVVIESMKMETIIRSPCHGKVAKLAHTAGDICKAGTILVFFEENISLG